VAGVIARATAKKRSTRQEFRSSIETPLILPERSVELQNLWVVWSCCMGLLKIELGIGEIAGHAVSIAQVR
jgi:hypothetical protein